MLNLYIYLTSIARPDTIHTILWYKEVGHKSEVLFRLDSYKPDTETL